MADYLHHGEPGLAFEHLLYMVTETGMVIRRDTFRRLSGLASEMGYPASALHDISVEEDGS